VPSVEQPLASNLKPIFFKNVSPINRPVGVGIGAKMSATLSPTATRQQIPTWNNLGRPKHPRAGVIGFNLETHTLEYWNGAMWLTLPMEKINV
jgi:hypothetical protein